MVEPQYEVRNTDGGWEVGCEKRVDRPYWSNQLEGLYSDLFIEGTSFVESHPKTVENTNPFPKVSL